MLKAHNVSVVVNGRRILDAVDFEARPAAITAIIGANGAGKSTLLRVLSGELSASQGSATLNGVDIATLDASALARRRAVVPQAAALAFSFTALDVVLLGASVPGFQLDEAATVDCGRRALLRLGLGDFAEQPYEQLSGGERQRVHVARALVQLEIARSEAGMPKALLMDEPTSSQDLGHQRLVVAEARRFAGEGATVIMVVHDLNLAAIVADQVALMHNGKVIAAGSPRSVFTKTLLSQAFDCGVDVVTDVRTGLPLVMPIAGAKSHLVTGAAE